MTEHHPTHGLRPLRAALPLLRPYTLRLLLALACLLIAAGAALAMPVAIRFAIDNGFSGGHLHGINRYFISLLGLGAVFALFAGLRHYSVMWIGERVVADLRRQVFERVICLEPRFFETTSSGEVLTRLGADTTLVQSVFGAGMSIALRSLIMLLGALIMLFVTSPRLTLMIFGLLPLVVLPVLLYGRKVRKLSRLSQDRVADTGSIAGETLNAIAVVQAFVLEHGFHEVQAQTLHDEGEDVAGLAAAEALVEPLLGADRKRRCLLVMKRAQALVVTAGLLQAHACADHVEQIRAGDDLVDECLRYPPAH